MILGNDPGVFERPLEFQFKRFFEGNGGKGKYGKKLNFPRMNFIPFSYGKRMCVGQVLAEVMIKVIVVEFLKIYELKKLPNWKRKMGFTPLYTITNPVFDLYILNK